jgi:hypothetical protein
MTSRALSFGPATLDTGRDREADVRQAGPVGPLRVELGRSRVSHCVHYETYILVAGLSRWIFVIARFNACSALQRS